MGLEAQCRVMHGGKTSDGKAMLETDFVLFRGDFRLKIPFASMREVSGDQGVLRIVAGDGETRLLLGEKAAKWADKILHPPKRSDKLGVKPGLRVSLLGIDDDGFLDEVRALTSDVTAGRAKAASDLVFLGTGSRTELNRLRTLESSLTPAGAVWVVYPKGKKEITENDVLSAGREAGLVDVKVASFSKTHTGLKFVIPADRRK